MTLTDLSQVVTELEKLAAASAPRSQTEWSIYRTLVHCAQSIDASRVGYPAMKPAFIRKTVGRLVLRRFLKKGAMNHDKSSPVPGADAIAEDGDLADAITTLRQSIDAFLGHQGELMPHFIFDAMTKDEYERIHAMHVADHLSHMSY